MFEEIKSLVSDKTMRVNTWNGNEVGIEIQDGTRYSNITVSKQELGIALGFIEPPNPKVITIGCEVVECCECKVEVSLGISSGEPEIHIISLRDNLSMAHLDPDAFASAVAQLRGEK